MRLDLLPSSSNGPAEWSLSNMDDADDDSSLAGHLYSLAGRSRSSRRAYKSSAGQWLRVSPWRNRVCGDEAEASAVGESD